MKHGHSMKLLKENRKCLYRANLEEGVYEVRGTWRGEAAVTCEAWQAQSTCLAFQLQSYTNQN